MKLVIFHYKHKTNWHNLSIILEEIILVPSDYAKYSGIFIYKWDVYINQQTLGIIAFSVNLDILLPYLL